MRHSTLKSVLALNTLLALGCSGENYAVLECKWLDENDEVKTAHFCYFADGLCKNSAPGPQEWCAWNVFHSEDPEDISKFSNPDGFAGYQWQEGECFDDYQMSKGYPPSNEPKGSCNDGPGGGSGSGPTSDSNTQPTTSEGESSDPTTDGTTGDDDVYFCSPQSPWKCANLVPDDALAADNLSYPDPYTDPDDPLSSTWDACWSAVDPDESPYVSKCVHAVSDPDARTKCQAWCNEYRIAMEDACDQDPDCTVHTTIDCALDGTYVNNMGQQVVGDLGGEQPVKKAMLPGYACDGEAAALGEGPFVQFVASASLVTPEGISADVGDIRGFLSYELSECTLFTCKITIDTLIGLTGAVEGGYTDSEGVGGMFEVHGMGFQTTAPFSGVWNRLFKKVYFPDCAVDTEYWAEAVHVEGLPITSGYRWYSAEIDDVVGKLKTKHGPLSLTLKLDLPESGMVSMSLYTLPD